MEEGIPDRPCHRFGIGIAASVVFIGSIYAFLIGRMPRIH